MDAVVILDFGSQYSQLIARRVREIKVYSELFPWNAAADQVLALNPRGFILSGGPASVYERNSPRIPPYVFESGLPILGICYDMQALAHAMGGRVAPSTGREYGFAQLHTLKPNPLVPERVDKVWMSHGDRIEEMPGGFVSLAASDNSPVAVMGDLARRYYGVQFHPEVRHTPRGIENLRNFVLDICSADQEWTPESIITILDRARQVAVPRTRALQVL